MSLSGILCNSFYDFIDGLMVTMKMIQWLEVIGGFPFCWYICIGRIVDQHCLDCLLIAT